MVSAEQTAWQAFLGSVDTEAADEEVLVGAAKVFLEAGIKSASQALGVEASELLAPDSEVS